jgi:hypothetical protein
MFSPCVIVRVFFLLRCRQNAEASFQSAWNCGAVVGYGIVGVIHDGPLDDQVLGSGVWGGPCVRARMEPLLVAVAARVVKS